MSKLTEKAKEFNRYFISGNDVPRDIHVRVRRDEWEELYALIQSLEEDEESREIIEYLTSLQNDVICGKLEDGKNK